MQKQTLLNVWALSLIFSAVPAVYAAAHPAPAVVDPCSAILLPTVDGKTDVAPAELSAPAADPLILKEHASHEDRPSFTRLSHFSVGKLSLREPLNSIKKLLNLPKRELAALFLSVTGLGSKFSQMQNWDGFLVLNYHRVLPPQDYRFNPDIVSATSEGFDEQMRLLKTHFDVVGLSELEDAMHYKNKRARYAMVTFDDGYRDNSEIAYPILKSQNIPGTFFVSTGFLDQKGVPWWEEVGYIVHHARTRVIRSSPWNAAPLVFHKKDCRALVRVLIEICRKLPHEERERFLAYVTSELNSTQCPPEVSKDLWMTWDMVREMKKGGMTFGAHTVNHPHLGSLQDSEQKYEIEESIRRLEEELGGPSIAFSYPFGDRAASNDFTRECLTNCGIKFAFEFFGGVSSFKQLQEGPHQIARQAIELDMSQNLVEAVFTLPRVFTSRHETTGDRVQKHKDRSGIK